MLQKELSRKYVLLLCISYIVPNIISRKLLTQIHKIYIYTRSPRWKQSFWFMVLLPECTFWWCKKFSSCYKCDNTRQGHCQNQWAARSTWQCMPDGPYKATEDVRGWWERVERGGDGRRKKLDWAEEDVGFGGSDTYWILTPWSTFISQLSLAPSWPTGPAQAFTQREEN